MAQDKALKDWCRGRIHDQYREAYKLSLEVGIQAQEKDDLDALARTMDTLDAAVEMLQHARNRLIAV